MRHSQTVQRTSKEKEEEEELVPYCPSLVLAPPVEASEAAITYMIDEALVQKKHILIM